VTVNIGTLEGGTSPNLVPTHAIARADIRLPVGITTDVLAAKLDDWLGPLEGVTWRAIRRFEASFTPPDHEIVVRTAQVAKEVLGSAPAVNMRIGGSDSRWYRPAGVPTVVLGLTPFNMGGADEYVLVDELSAVAKIHTLTAYDFLTG
jgi:acetylornithine deacetylase/succinyl-diaminopimelate desuccinylase-like protein